MAIKKFTWQRIFELIQSVTRVLSFEGRVEKFTQKIIRGFANAIVIAMFENDGPSYTHLAPSQDKDVYRFLLEDQLLRELFRKTHTSGSYIIKNRVLVENNSHAVSIALTARGAPTGIALFVRVRKPYTKREIDFLKVLSNQVAMLFENSRLFKEVNESKIALEMALFAGEMGVWDWDIEKGNIGWSESLYKMHGTTRENFSGNFTDFQKLIHPDDRDELTASIQKSLTTGKIFDHEFRVVRPEGGITWVTGRGRVTEFGLDRKPKRMLGVGINVTERKRLEKLLNENLRKFSAVFTNSHDAIFVTNLTGTILDFNPAALKLFGKKKKSLKGADLNNLVNGDISNKRGEVQIKKNKRTFEYLKTYGVTDATNLYFFRDITSIKEEMRRSEHFLGIAGHEFKTPLASIKALVHMMLLNKKVEKDEFIKEQLVKIDAKTQTLNTLIKNLLDITRIKQNKVDLFLESVNFQDLVKDIVSDFSALKTCSLSIVGNADIEVFLDKERIAQVIINLLKNAYKYSPDEKKIIVTLKKKKREVYFEVRDFGIGIPENEIDKIFELYYRPADSEENFDGYGVGLYISNEIVKTHGGRMWVKSKVGKGSRFSFSLPFVPHKKKKITMKWF